MCYNTCILHTGGMATIANFDEKDKKLFDMIEYREILKGVDTETVKFSDNVNAYEVIMPDDEFGFLHEAAIIEYHGTLFASWYNCSELELQGRTPVRGKRSKDGGKTWSDVEVLADDESGKIIYCPPVYGICDDKLYMLINEMVSADHMHAIDIFIYNEETEKFEFLRSIPSAFKLNTNVYKLANGKLMLPGRVAPEIDGFPRTPAVLISDSGKIDADWRLVYIQDGNEYLPDGTHYDHPESSAVVIGEKVYIFCRNDALRVPIIYESDDNGETWSKPISHNIPFLSSKIYSGTLSNGRNYVVGNDIVNWQYPAACEADGNLYVIYTAGKTVDGIAKRGAAVSVIPVN